MMVEILMCVLVIAGFNRCEKIAMDIRYAVTLENNADHSIGCCFALGGKFFTLYPDTTLPQTGRYIPKEIRPNSRFYKDSGLKWKEVYAQLAQDTMSVFIFHTDTLNKYPWEKIRDDYMILKRYDLSLEDLERCDYLLTYPPNEQLKGVKMYPPYKEN